MGVEEGRRQSTNPRGVTALARGQRPSEWILSSVFDPRLVAGKGTPWGPTRNQGRLLRGGRRRHLNQGRRGENTTWQGSEAGSFGELLKKCQRGHWPLWVWSVLHV